MTHMFSYREAYGITTDEKLGIVECRVWKYVMASKEEIEKKGLEKFKDIAEDMITQEIFSDFDFEKRKIAISYLKVMLLIECGLSKDWQKFETMAKRLLSGEDILWA